MNAADARLTREKMGLAAGRSAAEVATGLNAAEWQREVLSARSSGVNAVRVRHILVQSEELAVQLRQQLKEGASFEELAKAVSSCAATRGKGGEVGWVGVDDDFLDETLPRELRVACLASKPGDVLQQSSALGIHLLRIEDVFQTLQVSTIPRKKKLPGSGVSPRPLVELLSSRGGNADASAPSLAYAMDSMGCQMNTADAERMEGQLQAMGFSKATDPKKAQVIVLNTCSIRDHAEQKVYSYLGPHAARKQKGEDLAIVVAGCVAQQEGEALLRRVPEIDLVMGPQYANRIGDLLEGVFNGNQVVATAPTHIMEDVTQPQRQSTVCAWVNVIYGCNERCSYCVVPTTRGAEQSRPRESIRAEIEELVANGYREVTLLGQNIDAWGRDLTPKQTFAELLRDMAGVEGLDRMRFVTSHPRYMSERVVAAVADMPALCEMFHVPFQSGDDEVLRNMERGYTAKRYKQIVDQIRARLPDAAITADAIVGFPGETEEQFQNTLKLMEEVKFDQLNTAAYSPRPHTPAALWKNQVSEEEKMDRLQRINRLAAAHALERRQRYIGRVEEVLVEGRNTRYPSQVKGRNRQGCPIYFDGDSELLTGKLVPVKITEAQSYSLVGEQAGEPY